MSDTGLTVPAMNEQPARHGLMISVAGNSGRGPGFHRLHHRTPTSPSTGMSGVISAHSADKLIAW